MPEKPKVIVFGGPNLIDKGVQHLHGCELLVPPAEYLHPNPCTGGEAVWRVPGAGIEHRTEKVAPRFDRRNTKALLQQWCKTEPIGLRQKLFTSYMDECEWQRQEISLPDVKVVVFDCRMIIEDLQHAAAGLASKEAEEGPELHINLDNVLIPRNRGRVVVKEICTQVPHTLPMMPVDNPLFAWLTIVLDSALQSVQVVIATSPQAKELSAWLVEMVHAIVYPDCRNMAKAAEYNSITDPDDSVEPPPEPADRQHACCDVRMILDGNNQRPLDFGQPVRAENVLFFHREAIAVFARRAQMGIPSDEAMSDDEGQGANARAAQPFQTFIEAGYFPIAVDKYGYVCAFRFDKVNKADIYVMPRSFLSPDFRSEHWTRGLQSDLRILPSKDILHTGVTWADVMLRFTLKKVFTASTDREPWELQRLEVECDGQTFEADRKNFTLAWDDCEGASYIMRKRFPALIEYYAGLPECEITENTSNDADLRQARTSLREAIQSIAFPATILGSPLPRWPKLPDLTFEVIKDAAN